MWHWCFYELKPRHWTTPPKRSGEGTLHHSPTEKCFNIYSEQGSTTVIIKKEHLQQTACKVHQKNHLKISYSFFAKERTMTQAECSGTEIWECESWKYVQCGTSCDVASGPWITSFVMAATSSMWTASTLNVAGATETF